MGLGFFPSWCFSWPKCLDDESSQKQHRSSNCAAAKDQTDRCPLRIRSNSRGSSKNSSLGQKSPRTVKSKSYSFEEMRTATKHFSRKIGEGRFGPVYYGMLPGDQEVAIKVIAINSGQGVGSFVKEVDLVANLQDEHLVDLVGHCHESPHQMLVYRFIPKGSLRDHLHFEGTVGPAGDKLQTPTTSPLSWRRRLHIAMGVAKGLNYLHDVHKISGLPMSIHGDVKSANILLDKNLNPRLTDFGISKFASVDNSGVPTLVTGTPGYLDPEFPDTVQQLNAKSDVYSFGVVLLELISGRPATRTDNAGVCGPQCNLVDWARSFRVDGKVMGIVDPRLEGRFEKESMLKVAELAMFSVEPQGVNRPKMCKIVEGLAEAIVLERATSTSRAGPVDDPWAQSGSQPHENFLKGPSTHYASLAPARLQDYRNSPSSQHTGSNRSVGSDAMISFPSSQSLERLI